ncbi:hypothetical protein [Streptomyces sp. NPDC015242]|uniref:hypothetical protein n=1 Tax=Streptomyces sp. NPDC015242 TaxID=3364951 RepID=UPI0037000DD2
MTVRDSGTERTPGAVRVRATGQVTEEDLGYVRGKVAAVLARQGLPGADGEVRITKAAAHHVEQPWSAAAELHVGRDLVVVHARGNGAHEVADRLQDRLRAQVERLAHRAEANRRSAAPPPWRGGPAGPGQEERPDAGR